MQMQYRMRYVVLLPIMLIYVQKHSVTGQTLKDVLKFEPFGKITLGRKFWGIDLANLVASESSDWLSSSHWSIRHALHHCLRIRQSSNYKTDLHGAVFCLKQYYKFCIRENAVTHAQQLKSHHPPECMRFRFSETTLSQNAKIWDIHVPLGFHINLTVTDLQMTYHPRGQCYGNHVKDGRYTGQGLAIDNYTTVCQRTKHHSYLLPMSKARIILNYTRIPDCPVLEFLYEAITKPEPMNPYLTLLRLTLLNVFYFDLFQNTGNHLILYIQTDVRSAISLVNITLRCENNFNRGKELKFIDGPIFLANSYLQTYPLIAILTCENLVSSGTNTSLSGNNGRYLYLDQVKASIGDITAVLKGPDIDISKLDFSFTTHLPDTPYGNFT